MLILKRTESYELREHSEKDLELFLKDESGEMQSVSRGFAFCNFSGYSSFFEALAMMRFDAEKRLCFDIFYQADVDSAMKAAIYGAVDLIYDDEALFYKTEKGWYAINYEEDKEEDYFLGSKQIAYNLFGEIRGDGTASIAYHETFGGSYEICEYKKLIYEQKPNPANIEVVAGEREDGCFDLFVLGEPADAAYFKLRLSNRALVFKQTEDAGYRIVYGGPDDLPETVILGEQIILHYVGDNHANGAEGQVIYFDAEGRKRELSGRIYLISHSALIVDDEVINPEE